jgi:hypothetical protein
MIVQTNFQILPETDWFSYYGFWNSWLKDALKEPAGFMFSKVLRIADLGLERRLP